MLFVGTLDGRKRGRFLLDCFQHGGARPRIPTRRSTSWGRRPGAAGVTYHTGITDDALAGLYRRAWVYASPSTYEGFGLPYLEAMACGTPVVASPNPGSREVLDDGRCGVLATDARLRRELTAILGDAPRRSRARRQGLRRAREYSLSRMVGEYEELLYELTEVHAGSAARV
jgi:glycosyltransferase involved in cell wall biosynthesis